MRKRTLCTLAAVSVLFLTPLGQAAFISTFQQGDANGYSGTIDTHLDEAVPDTSRGSDVQIVIDGNGGGSLRNDGLLCFNNIFGYGTGQIYPTQDVIIYTAKLTINVVPTGADDAGTTIHRMLHPWSESDTWNTLGDGLGWHNTSPGVQADDNEARSLADCSLLPPYSVGPLVIDVTASVQAWSNGEPNYGWVFLLDNAGAYGWAFSSSEDTNVAYRPYLYVEWVPEPTTLSLLALGGLALLRRRR